MMRASVSLLKGGGSDIPALGCFAYMPSGSLELPGNAKKTGVTPIPGRDNPQNPAVCLVDYRGPGFR